jgi:hypothetical protein
MFGPNYVFAVEVAKRQKAVTHKMRHQIKAVITGA